MYINTGQEFDGSDSGARPDEAVSWGKIKIDGESVKVRSSFETSKEFPTNNVENEQVYADATLVFPLIVAGTFGKAHWDALKEGKTQAL